MGIFKPLSAKNAKVRFDGVDGTAITSRHWQIKPSSDLHDITNNEGEGFADCTGGILDCEITIDFDWDSGNNPFLELGPSSPCDNLFLYTDGVGSPHWYFPFTLVGQMPHDAGVRGKHENSVMLQSKGQFYPPGVES